MPDKLEVITGPGLVARFGQVAVWAGPQATPALQAHLVNEAQRAAQSAAGVDELANSLIAVLQRGDPEPQSPFALVGPGANGLTLFLHGPVQAWDSGHWLAPQPVPGWMLTSIGRPWPLIVMPYGAPPPPQSQQGNPLDLLSGAVPGSGFILLRPPSGPAPQPQQAGQTTVPGVASPAGGSPFGAAPGGPPLASAGPGPSSSSVVASQAVAATATLAPPVTPARDGPVFDLRVATTAAAPPLAPAARTGGPKRPEAVGVLCPRGHLNHPRSTTCARCGALLPPGSPQVSGPRPPVGVLLADDGSIWSLAGPCLIGSDPASAPEVQSGAAQAIAMRAGSNHTMAPVQAEVQVRGWSTFLVDRGAEGGTCTQGPAVDGWSQLARNEQRELTSGSHLSCGGRVLTYLSAWPA